MGWIRARQPSGEPAGTEFTFFSTADIFTHQVAAIALRVFPPVISSENRRPHIGALGLPLEELDDE